MWIFWEKGCCTQYDFQSNDFRDAFDLGKTLTGLIDEFVMIFGWGVQECGAMERLFKLHEHMFFHVFSMRVYFALVSTTLESVLFTYAGVADGDSGPQLTKGLEEWLQSHQRIFQMIWMPQPVWDFRLEFSCTRFLGSSGVLPWLDSVKHLGFPPEKNSTSWYIITNLATVVQVKRWPWIPRPKDYFISWDSNTTNRIYGILSPGLRNRHQLGQSDSGVVAAVTISPLL